eukprot:7377725-Prymnesium_polylepis.1
MGLPLVPLGCGAGRFGATRRPAVGRQCVAAAAGDRVVRRHARRAFCSSCRETRTPPASLIACAHASWVSAPSRPFCWSLWKAHRHVRGRRSFSRAARARVSAARFLAMPILSSSLSPRAMRLSTWFSTTPASVLWKPKRRRGGGEREAAAEIGTPLPCGRTATAAASKASITAVSDTSRQSGKRRRRRVGCRGGHVLDNIVSTRFVANSVRFS